MSEPILIDSASFLQLSATHTYTNRSLEFSIIEADNETPIAPIEQGIILNEKIFSGLPPRFEADTNIVPMIYRNGEISE